MLCALALQPVACAAGDLSLLSLAKPTPESEIATLFDRIDDVSQGVGAQRPHPEQSLNSSISNGLVTLAVHCQFGSRRNYSEPVFMRDSADLGGWNSF